MLPSALRMSSNVRETIAAAQAAELKGDKATASGLLRQAAEQYRDAGNATRALKLLRHARKLEGVDEDAEDELPGNAAPLIERKPVLADPSLDAWCSFCCRPRKEVGALVAAPTGTFVCAECVDLSAALLGSGRDSARLPAQRETARAQPGGAEGERDSVPTSGQHLLVKTTSVTEALLKLAQRFSVALILGPEGSGKTALASSLPKSSRIVVADCSTPMPAADGQKLAAEMSARRIDQVVLLVRAATPKPVLLLDGPLAIKIPIFDTASLVEAAQSLVPKQLLSLVDCVIPMQSLDLSALKQLAAALLEAKSAELDDAAINQLCAIALNSGRGAHELVSLISRIPSGRWQSS